MGMMLAPNHDAGSGRSTNSVNTSVTPTCWSIVDASWIQAPRTAMLEVHGLAGGLPATMRFTETRNAVNGVDCARDGHAANVTMTAIMSADAAGRRKREGA